MSMTSTIRDLIDRLLDGYELGEDLRDELQKIIEKIDEYAESQAQGEPPAIFWARILSEFIESLGDRMPPVVSSFIELYAKALKEATGITTYLACIRYWMLRRQGCSHDEAAYAASLTDENAVWCRTLWNLHHLPRTDPNLEPTRSDDADDEGLEPPADDAEWQPERPRPEGPWVSERFKPCCEDEGGKDVPVSVNWGTLEVTDIGGNGYLVGEFSISHPCGIAAHVLRLKINHRVPNLFDVGVGGWLGPGGSGGMIIEESTATEVKFKVRRRIQLYGNHERPVPPKTLTILAISNCYTTPARGANRRDFRKP